MTELKQAIQAWLDRAEAKLANGGVGAAEVQQLRALLDTATPRQRLLYLHTRTPSVTAPVIGMALHEPVAGQKETLRTRTDWPYDTVQAAMVDGWQVIHFPNLRSPYDDVEMDYVGYEFILQKLEVMVP